MIIDIETNSNNLLERFHQAGSYRMTYRHQHKTLDIKWFNGYFDIPRYSDIPVGKMEKVHYQHFLRLYNRKRFQKIADLDLHGYPKVRADRGKFIEPRDWCRANFKPGSYINAQNIFWFAYEADAVQFKLVWG